MAQVTRVLIGHFEPAKADNVAKLVADTIRPWTAAMKTLDGNVAAYGGVDRTRNVVVAVSIWASEETAKQVDSSQAVIQIAQRFVSEGIRFDPPIIAVGA